MRIALDIQGGDYAPQALLTGAKQALLKHSDIQLLLVGTQKSLNSPAAVELFKDFKPRLTQLITGDSITMEESPVKALKAKPNSSIVKGIQALQKSPLTPLLQQETAGPRSSPQHNISPDFPAYAVRPWL